MPDTRFALPLAAGLLLVGASALAYAQNAPRAPAAQHSPTAPGVTRAVESPDPTVNQTQPDAHQPETATDSQAHAPETARDNPKEMPETATDASHPSQADKLAKKGVRSNAPAPRAPRG